jgi:hypothetical protein
VQPAAKSTVVAALHAAIPRHRLLLPNAPATMGVTRSREHLCPRFYCHSSTPAFCCWMLLPTSTTGSEGESAGETQSALADWRCVHSGPTRAQGGLTQQGTPSAEITLKQTRRYRSLTALSVITRPTHWHKVQRYPLMLAAPGTHSLYESVRHSQDILKRIYLTDSATLLLNCHCTHWQRIKGAWNFSQKCHSGTELA